MPFPALREFAQNTSHLNNLLHNMKGNIKNLKLLELYLDKIEATEHEIFTAANTLKQEAMKREKESQFLSLESMSWLEEVLKQRRLIGEQVATLDDFAQGEKHLSAHRALKEARHLLKIIKDINLVDFIASATDVANSVGDKIFLCSLFLYTN